MSPLKSWTPVDVNDPRAPSVPAPETGVHVVGMLSTSGVRDMGWAPRAALEIGRAWGSEGVRVVLFDVGLEEPTLHEAAGLDNLEGVTDALLFGTSFKRLAQPLSDGLFLATAGTAVPDGEALRAHPRWRDFVQGFTEAGALLILYFPADAPGGDELLRQCDAVVVLTEQGQAAEVVLPSGMPILASVGPQTEGAEAEVVGDGFVAEDTPAETLAEADEPDEIDEPVATEAPIELEAHAETDAPAETDEPAETETPADPEAHAGTDDPADAPAAPEAYPEIDPTAELEESTDASTDASAIDDLIAPAFDEEPADEGPIVPISDLAPDVVEESAETEATAFAESADDSSVDAVAEFAEEAAEDLAAESEEALPTADASADAVAGAPDAAEPSESWDDPLFSEDPLALDEALAGESLDLGSAAEDWPEAPAEADAAPADWADSEPESTATDEAEQTSTEADGDWPAADLVPDEADPELAPALEDAAGSEEADGWSDDPLASTDPLSATLVDGGDPLPDAPSLEEILADGTDVVMGEGEDAAEAAEAAEGEVDISAVAAAVDRTRKPKKASRSGGPLVLLVLLLAVLAALIAGWLGYVEIPFITPGEGVGPETANAAEVRPAVESTGTTAGEVGSVESQSDSPLTEGAVEASLESPLAAYVLALGSFGDLESALNRANAYNLQLPAVQFIVAPVEVRGRPYYRLLAGPAVDTVELSRVRGRLRQAQTEGGDEWIIRQAGLAYLVGTAPRLALAERNVRILSELGIPAHVLRYTNGEGDEVFRVYAGAFANSDEAGYLGRVLEENSIRNAPLTERRGTRPE